MIRLIKRFDVRTSLTYGIVATLWIISTDLLASLLFGRSPDINTTINIFKGLGFIVITSLALYFVLSAELRKRLRIEHELQLERDISPVAILVFNIDGRITYANRQAEKLLGKPRQEIIGHLYDDPMWHITDHDGNLIDFNNFPNMMKMVQSRQSYSGIERAIEVTEGKRLLLEISFAPFVDDADGITGAIVTFTDVTAARTHQKRLRESEEHFRLLFNNNPIPMWVFDLETLAFLEVNDAAITHYGYSRDEFLAMHITDIRPTEDISKLIEDIQQTRPTLRNSGEWRHTLKNSQIINVEIASHTIEYAGRHAALVVAQDITERKAAEKALRESEASLKQAQAIAHLGDWKWDTQTHMVHWSDETYRIYGLDRASFTGRVEDILEYSIHPDDKAVIGQAIADGMNKHKRSAMEYRIVWPDGSVHDIWSIPGESITDEHGNIIRLSGVFQDITERKAAERALLESEARYRMLIEQASDAIFIIDNQDRYLEVNSAACTLLGYSREEILQMRISDLVKITPNTPIRYEEIKQGKTLLREREMIRKDGTLVSVEFSSKMLLDGNVQTIGRDITERKRAEEELRLKSSALEAAANGIAITDVKGIIQWVNPAFAALTGYETDEAEGHNPRELVRSGLHNQLFYEEMWETILKGEVWQGEIVNRRKNSSLYTEEMTITPVHDESGEISHFIAVKQDISERKLTEAAIHRLNTELEERVIERTTQLNHIKNRIESILNSTADSIVYSRLDGRIEQVNPAFTKAFGYQSDEILLQSLFTLVIPQHGTILEQALAAIVADCQPQQVEVNVCCKDGKTFDAAVMLSPVIENGDRMVGIVSSIHDITNLNYMLRHAMDLSEIKSRYVSMAAHDLRNPMAVILTSSETLAHYYAKLTEEKKQEKFNQIKASIKVMTDILDDILIMGQVESGKLVFHPAPLEVTAFCQMLVTEIVQATGTTIHIDFATEDINQRVNMDAKLLRHILGNLLSNAIKYSPAKSTITFTVSGKPDEISFRIQDQGIGIPKDEQARLFETFHRARNATHIRGTGLGLAIVKQSVELHGGTIDFESEEGYGATFVVNFPVKMNTSDTAA